ncbi:MAG: MamK family actin-like protein [Planctomycetota bacterium]|jgi:rod shape-determining protein MreB
MSESNPQQGVLYIGIDLGTSRSSIAASNGVLDSLPSYVGYPKDVVARKSLGKDVLFGQEAIDKRLSLDFHRPLAKGVLKTALEQGDGHERAAHDLIGECIRRAKPRADELVYAVIGVPAQASMESKDALLKAAKGSIDSVMLCSEPFSVAYGLDLLDDVLVVDIGAGTVDLCRMHGTMPEDADQLTLDKGGDFVDECLSERISKSHPEAQFSLQMVKGIKERFGSVEESSQPAIVELPVKGKPQPFDLREEIRSACLEIVPPIVDGLAELISTFDPEFQERLKNRILLAGGGSSIKGLDVAIEQHMLEALGGGKVLRTEESVYGGANGALKIANDMPDEFWEQLR